MLRLMRFSIGLATDRVEAGAEFVSAAAVAEMAHAAEAAGFDACFVTDHPIPDDRWLASGGHHTLDPFVALSFAASATTRIRLQTHVLVLAYRNPFLTAKAVATLDVLSGGRTIVGVAAGYLEAEFAALGVDFSARNELTDEAIDTLRKVWSEEGVALEGRHFRSVGNTALPFPSQRPGPPLWVGGNSRRAIRRAVEKGDGWLPFPAPARMASRIRTASLESVEDLEKRIDYAHAHARSVGRTEPLDIAFVPFGLPMRATDTPDYAAVRESAAQLAAVGVSWLTINVPCRNRADYVERVATLGEELVKPLRGSE